MNLAFEYIKYRWNAKGRHGTHSPFVYDFVDKCLASKIDVLFKKERSNLFNKLNSDRDKIKIEDFGVGSKKLSNIRQISQIFNNSSSKGKYGELLYKLAKFYQPNRILELGTSLGVGTIHLSKGSSKSEIITIEACNAIRNEALKNFSSLGCTSVKSILSTFKAFIDSYSGESFDLVFIDGHHDGSALKDYLKSLEKFTHNDTLFILDDIRWSDSMFDAWNHIIADEEYHVTIDLFRMGLILRREQQVKEHFVIKI